MAPRRAEEIPLKRVAASGCKLASHLPAGEILTDITQNSWRLGSSIGSGGFGDIYLASNEINKPVGQNAKYVIKIEPHNNGPLFVEMNFYIRAARKPMIEEWCEEQGLRQVGIPYYEGSGSHYYGGERYRFLVIPRYGIDINYLFLSNERNLSTKLVNSLAVQMLYALEYIHSKGYAHSDVKGCNILLKRTSTYEMSPDLEKTPAYLLDYGLAYRYRTSNGIHKPFQDDERRAHEGTLEYTSRDAHHGTHSRRGDLETLGYNLLQWLCGKLPWEKEEGGLDPSTDPDNIQIQKENLMENVDHFMLICFKEKRKIPENITQYMKYICNLKFESRPDYGYLRGLFRQNVNLECLFGNKRMSVYNENNLHMRKLRGPLLRERKPCRPVNAEVRITRNSHPVEEEVKKEERKKVDFRWEVILACHPDKVAKINLQPPLSPLTPPPSPPLISVPTYAMLAVMRRMREKTQNGLIKQRTFPNSSELKPKWMTPAMEEVAEMIKKRNLQQNASITKPRRLLRSRAAQDRNKPVKRSIETDQRTSPKRRKLSY